jgi:hypothetical protein
MFMHVLCFYERPAGVTFDVLGEYVAGAEDAARETSESSVEVG